MHTDQPVQPVTFQRAYATTVTFDDRAIQIAIKKFSLDEYTTFMRDFGRCGLTGKKDQVFVERHRLTAEEKPEDILARVELDETTDARQARRQRDIEEEAFARGFLIESITTFVTAKPGQLYWEDDTTTSITAGADLLELFAARQDVLQAMLSEIYIQNCLSAAAKKKLKELSASAPGSTAPTLTAPGDAPAPTAAPASALASVPSDAATTPSPSPAPVPSGAMTS